MWTLDHFFGDRHNHFKGIEHEQDNNASSSQERQDSEEGHEQAS
jgi:hypothetical protein